MTLLTPDFYKEELIESNFYPDSTDLIIESIIPNTEGVEIDEIEMKNALAKEITPQWLQIQTEGMIDTVFWLLQTNAQISEIELVIDFQGPHNAFFSDTTQLLNPVPEKIHGLALLSMLASDESLNLEMLAEKPDISGNEKLKNWQKTLETIQTLYVWVSIILIGSIVLAAVLILASLLLVKKNLISIFKLLGNTFLVPGIIGVVSLITQKVIYGFYKDDIFSGQMSNIMAGTDLFSNLVNSMVQRFINLMLWPFGICLAIGVILLVTAFLIKKYNKVSNQ